MTTDFRSAPIEGNSDEPRRHRLPTGPKVLAVILLAIPLAALAVVPLYSRTTPIVWGFPFFYWYQLLWVLLTPLFTWGAYVVITRARAASR